MKILRWLNQHKLVRYWVIALALSPIVYFINPDNGIIYGNIVGFVFVLYILGLWANNRSSKVKG